MTRSVQEIAASYDAAAIGFEPLGNLVLIRVDAPEAVSAGGVLLPDAAQDKPSQGSVLAVGPDCATLQVGDRVVFQKYTGTDVELEGELYLAVKESEILGRLKVKLAT